MTALDFVWYLAGISTYPAFLVADWVVESLRNPSWRVQCRCGHVRRGPWRWVTSLHGRIHRRGRAHREWKRRAVS